MRPNFFLDVHIKGRGSKGKYETFVTIGGNTDICNVS